jgi:ATP-dependent Clp protease ATP-binding subunit ClpC
MMHGYNFTERVRKVLAKAREESARLHHEYVGTEHLLLALAREDEGVATAVLDHFDVDREALRRRVGEFVKAGRASTMVGPDLPYTSRAKIVLEQSMYAARELGHSYVGTEHLLLGLLREGKGIAAQLLGEAGLTLDAARSEVQRVLGVAESRPPTQGGSYEPGALKSRPVERVEVILHYADGRRFEGSFDTVREAIAYLLTRARPNGD